MGAGTLPGLPGCALPFSRPALLTGAHARHPLRALCVLSGWVRDATIVREAAGRGGFRNWLVVPPHRER